MLLKQKLFAIFMLILLIVIIFELVRRRKLREEYSWLWLLTGLTIGLLVIWYDFLVFVSKLIGAIIPTTTLFIFAILFLMLISLHFCIKISSLTDKVIKLTQELAILKSSLEKEDKDTNF